MVSRRWQGLAVSLLLLLAAGAAEARPQDESPIGSRLGAISGAVIETDGTAVPGVTVRLTGPAPRETERWVIADAQGRFQFDDLRHGDYRITVELPGLQAPSDVSVVVLPGQQVETNVVLSLFAYEVEVSVVARSADQPLVIDTDSTADRRELTNRELERLPLPVEQALDALPVFPGVVRSPNGLISIGGTLPSDSVYLFNGADLMDPFTGEYRLLLPLEAVESMSLEAGVSSADYGDRLGGTVNVTTARAGANWDTEIASPLPRPWFNNGKLAGVRRFNPRVRISGPLSPELTMSQSIGYRFERERVFDTAEGSSDRTVVEQWQALTQFDWTPNDSHDLRFMLLGSPERESLAGLSGLTPEQATSDVSNSTVALVVKHQGRLGARSFVDTTAQFNRQTASVVPERLPPTGSFEMFPDRNDGTAFSQQSRRSQHWQLKSVYNRVLGPGAGTHLFKVGFEVHHLALRGRYTNDPIQIFDEEGRLRREIVQLENPVPGLEGSGDKWEAAVFVQERWRPSERFWIDAGLRLSRDSAVKELRLAPRLGMAWDLRGDGGTLLKGSVGILNRRIYLAEQFWELFPTRVETTFDENGNGQRVYLPARRAEDLDSPQSLIWQVSATQRIGPRLTAHVSYSERHSEHLPIFDVRPHTPVAVTMGAPIMPFAAPAGTGLLLSSFGKATARQLELTTNLRIGQQDQLFISYVKSRTDGDLNDFSRVATNFPDPVLRPNARAPLRVDVPDRIVLWGTFHLPWQIIAAPSIEWRSGLPWSTLDIYREYAGEAHDRRFPDYFSPDLQVTKGFRIQGIPVRAGVLVTNFLFRDNPRDVIAIAGTERFGEFLNKVPSRIRLRFRTTF